MQRNFCKLLVIAVGFLATYSVFNTSQNLAAHVLKELDYGNMGFYSIAIKYGVEGIVCLFATPFVNKCGERISSFVGALCFTLYAGCFILASGPT